MVKPVSTAPRPNLHGSKHASSPHEPGHRSRRSRTSHPERASPEHSIPEMPKPRRVGHLPESLAPYHANSPTRSPLHLACGVCTHPRSMGPSRLRVRSRGAGHFDALSRKVRSHRTAIGTLLWSFSCPSRWLKTPSLRGPERQPHDCHPAQVPEQHQCECNPLANAQAAMSAWLQTSQRLPGSPPQLTQVSGLNWKSPESPVSGLYAHGSRPLSQVAVESNQSPETPCRAAAS